MNFTTLQELLIERTTKEQFSGVVRLTRDGDELFAGAYGFADRSWKIRNHLDLRFDTASMTKLFTAAATLQLIDQGKFDLETAVIPFLGIEDTTISDAVSVYHLLTHSSGIGDDAEEENGEDYADLWKERPSYMVTETADFFAPIHPQTTQLRTRGRCTLQQCEFYPAWFDDRKSKRPTLSRLCA